MKQFNIYANSRGGYEAVKQGWCWPAFFFGIFWAFVKRMWLLGLGVIGAFILLGALEAVIEDYVSESVGQQLDQFANLLSFGVWVAFGVSGNRWREKNLLSRGFELKGAVTADSGASAVALYVNSYPVNQPG